jgi:Mce-associated membrane protein
VSLYDLLDVDRDASPEQIRTAWKGAIADLDPSDRRFRAYNQAAEVLLDPERRATYNAELEAAEPEPAPEPESAPAAPPRADDRLGTAARAAGDHHLATGRAARVDSRPGRLSGVADPRSAVR